MLKDFYLSDQRGSNISQINSKRMQLLAQNKPAITSDALYDIIKAHELFLATGGSGGQWRVFITSGTVYGIYTQIEQNTAPEGKQAIFDMLHFDLHTDLQELSLPYSSWCGCYAKGQDFSDINLGGALLCDALLERTIFADANLAHADFSRANLRHASFMNANLVHADFENADLTGADFTGAIIDNARFPGAILHGIRR
jgi:hypothetical protein